MSAGPSNDELRDSVAYPIFYRATLTRWIARTIATESSLDSERLELLASDDVHNARPPPAYPEEAVKVVQRVATEILAGLPAFIDRDQLILGCLDAAVRLLCVDDPSVIRAQDRLIEVLRLLRIAETNSH